MVTISQDQATCQRVNVSTWPARVGTATALPSTPGTAGPAILIDTTTFSGHKFAKATAASTYKRLRATGLTLTSYHNNGSFTSIVYTYRFVSTNNFPYHVGWGLNTLNAATQRQLLFNNTSAAANYRIETNTNATPVSIAASTTPTTTKFFMTHTYNGSTVTVYRDLTSLGSITHSTSCGTGATALLIGANAGASFCGNDTCILAWQLFPRVLSLDEITAVQSSIAASFV
jgi:hypothetical protein